MDLNPMAADAPLVVLLDKKNLRGKSDDELLAIVQKLRTYVAQPQSLKAKLNAESVDAKTRKVKVDPLDALAKLGL